MCSGIKLDDCFCSAALSLLADLLRQIAEQEKKLLTFDRLMDKLRASYGLSRKIKSRSSDTASVDSGSRPGKSGRSGEKYKIMWKE